MWVEAGGRDGEAAVGIRREWRRQGLGGYREVDLGWMQDSCEFCQSCKRAIEGQV